MKLRNKKTGDVGDLLGSCDSVPFIGIMVDYHDGNPVRYEYDSLAKFNEEWEDYESKEPLIKNEKIRKIIRAWADENDTAVVEYKPFKNEFVDGYLNIIGFNRKFNELCDKSYTIAELCGEEETPKPLEPTFIDLDERIREKEEE